MQRSWFSPIATNGEKNRRYLACQISEISVGDHIPQVCYLLHLNFNSICASRVWLHEFLLIIKKVYRICAKLRTSNFNQTLASQPTVHIVYYLLIVILFNRHSTTISLELTPFIHWFHDLSMDNEVQVDSIIRVEFTEIWVPIDQCQTWCGSSKQKLFSKNQKAANNFAIEIYGAKSSPFWLSMSRRIPRHSSRNCGIFCWKSLKPACTGASTLRSQVLSLEASHSS